MVDQLEVFGEQIWILGVDFVQEIETVGLENGLTEVVPDVFGLWVETKSCHEILCTLQIVELIVMSKSDVN